MTNNIEAEATSIGHQVFIIFYKHLFSVLIKEREEFEQKRQQYLDYCDDYRRLEEVYENETDEGRFQMNNTMYLEARNKYKKGEEFRQTTEDFEFWEDQLLGYMNFCGKVLGYEEVFWFSDYLNYPEV